MYADKVLTCSDCSQEFTFTASEQEFYADRGFSEPRRCSSCRAQRKAQRNGGAGAGSSSGGSRGGYSGGYTGSSGGYSGGGYSGGGGGGGYSGGGYSGGGGGYSGGGGGYSGGGYSGGGGGSRSYNDRPPREMFDATCSECGKIAKVPFRPTSGKPVYCTDCFARRRG
jgi:CxxC-x17-CxxC domain-containing protein